jgi:hypothetical protein
MLERRHRIFVVRKVAKKVLAQNRFRVLKHIEALPPPVRQ